MFAKGIDDSVLEARDKLTDLDIASYYLGINKLPIRICSPLREDRKPSFGLYTRDGLHIYYVDFATGDKGSLIDLMQRMFGLSYNDTWTRIANEMTHGNKLTVTRTIANSRISVLTEGSKSIIETTEREWTQDDINYWLSFGITKEWLVFANVHPISYITFIKNNQRFSIPTDKLAYCFLEFKEGHTTTKVYQPLNKDGKKWFSTHDRSVVSLWTKVPQIGEKIVICSSLKDALCFWSNTGIPAIAPQGEGYTMSETAILNLKSRYKEIYILYDNDAPGIADAKRLAEQTGFINLSLPQFTGGKDVSDLYKSQGKQEFLKIIKSLFN